MKRVGHLWEKLISDENLTLAIDEVNRTHHWHTHHTPNKCTAWVEETKEERVKELREILLNGFVQAKPRVRDRYDASAQKWRRVSEPRQWPDQYVHHALIQVIQPVMMRGMDKYCCGSIRGRGTHYGKRAIERWMDQDEKGTKYCLQCDIRHFYQSLKPEIVMARMRQLIKDRLVLDLIERIVKDGVLIGAYTSQWFANTVLQPLDHMLREGGFCVAHDVRYMDNISMSGSNKRKLMRAKRATEVWLNAHGLELKGDWQVYPVVKRGKSAQGRRRRGRMPSALGYRYGRGYTLPRKRNLLRIKRQIKRYRKRRDAGKPIYTGMAAGMLSRFGQLKHCNNHNIYKLLLRGERIQRELKRIIRENQRKRELLTWNMFLERRGTLKCSRQKAESTAA